MSTLFLTGFEHGFVGTGFNVGGGLTGSTGLTGTGWSASTTSPRNGAYCAHLVAPASTANWFDIGPSNLAQAKVVTRFGVKVSSRPSSGTSLLASGTMTGGVVSAFRLTISSTGVLALNTGGAGTIQTGSTIDTTNWHLIEIQMNVSVNPWTVDWKIDGVLQPQASFVAAATTVGNLTLGNASTTTSVGTTAGYTADYDDFIIGTWVTAATDWYGDGKVLGQLAGSDGTHATITSLSPGDAGTAYSGTVTTANTMVDDPPATGGWSATRSVTDNLALRVATVGAYAEIKPATTAEIGLASAVRAIMSYSSSTTTANLAACDVRNSAAAITELNGLTGGVGKGYNVTANNFKGAIVTRPAAGWTAAEVNAVLFRFGGCTSVDISPVPTVQAMMLEVDWPVAAGTTYNDTGSGIVAASGTATESLINTDSSPFVKNPSFETDLSGWTQTNTAGITGIIWARDNTWAQDGSWSLHMQGTSGTTGTAYSLSAWAATGVSGIPVSPLLPYTIGAWVNSISPMAAVYGVRLAIHWYTASGAVAATPSNVSGYFTSSDLQRLTYKASAPADAAFAAPRLYLYWGSTAPSNTTLEAYFDAVLFSGDNLILDGTGVETYSPPITYTDSRSGTITANGTGTESWSVTIPPTSYDAAVLAESSVIGFWPLNETSGNPQDRKGTAHATLEGGPTLGVTGPCADGETAIFCDGIDDAVVMPNPTVLQIRPSISVEIWMHLVSTGNGPMFMWEGSFGMLSINNGEVRGRLAGTSIVNEGMGTWDSGTNFAHFVLTFDDTTKVLTVYKNAVAVYTRTLTGSMATYGGGNWRIARHSGIGPSSGSFAKAALYDAALTPAQIQTHYDARLIASITADDSRSGTITSSGTGVESAVANDTLIGTVAVSGTGTESVVRSASATATITVSGSAVESSVYTDIRTVTGVVSGVSSESAVFTESGTAVSTVSGTGTDNRIYTDTSSGTTLISGTNSESIVFADTGTDIIVVSGIGTESYISGPTYTDVASGTVATQGTATETYSGTDSVVGTGIVSGMGIDVFSASDVNTGTCVVSGIGTDSAVHTSSGTDSIIVSGTGVDTWIYTDTGTGTIVVSGTGIDNRVYPDTGTGTTVIAGTGTDSYIYTDASTVTVAVIGTGTDTAAYADSGISTEVATGTSTESVVYTASATGTTIVSGVSSETAIHNASAVGTSVVSGTGIDNEVYVDTASGTTLVSGTGSDSFASLIGYIDARTGQITISGTSADSQSHASTPIGSVLVNGTGVESQTHTSAASGSVLVDGTSSESLSYTNAVTGSLLVTGVGVESQSHTSTVSDSLVVNGTGIESQSHTSTATGSLLADGSSAESQSHTSTATGLVLVIGTGVESQIHEIIYTDISEGNVTSTGTGVDSFSYTDTVIGTVTNAGTGFDSVSYSNTVTGIATLLDTGSVENYEYTDASTDFIVLTGTARDSYTQAVQPTPISKVVALNRIHVMVQNKAPIRSMVTSTAPIRVQIVLQSSIKVEATKPTGMKVLVANR